MTPLTPAQALALIATGPPGERVCVSVRVRLWPGVLRLADEFAACAPAVPWVKRGRVTRDGVTQQQEED